MLIVDQPGDVVRRAVSLGASEVSPVSEEHGWLLGPDRQGTSAVGASTPRLPEQRRPAYLVFTVSAWLSIIIGVVATVIDADAERAIGVARIAQTILEDGALTATTGLAFAIGAKHMARYKHHTLDRAEAISWSQKSVDESTLTR